MVEAKLDLLWVPNAMLPANFVICGVEPQTGTFKGRTYEFFVLHLQSNDGRVFQYEAKFGDKNFLINTISPKTEEWLGERIGMRIGENKYKQICKPV